MHSTIVKFLCLISVASLAACGGGDGGDLSLDPSSTSSASSVTTSNTVSSSINASTMPASSATASSVPTTNLSSSASSFSISSSINASAMPFSSATASSMPAINLSSSTSSFSSVAVAGNLIHTKVAEPQSKYPRGILVSSRYRVMAKLASDPSPWDEGLHTTATYEAWPDLPDAATTVPNEYKNIHIHMAQVDADARVHFRIDLIDNTIINTLELKPSRITSLQETQVFTSKSVEFEVDPFEYTRSILVEINEPLNSPNLNHGLMVFLNPISIAPTGNNVLTLPSGVLDKTTAPDIIDQNDALIIENNSPYTAIYIPRDTIINGRIQAKKSGVSVSGRGMVVGSRWSWPKSQADWFTNYPITADKKVAKALIELNNGKLEGISSVLPYHFNFGGGRTSTNLKAFGWRHSTDGVHGVDTMRGCFTKVNDDHVYFRKRVIEYNTFWGMSNGSIFQGGWGNAGDTSGGGSGGRIAHNDIIRGEWRGDGGARQNNGIFGSVDQASGNHDTATFEDIRIQGHVCRMLNFEMISNMGTWKNFTFKDIWFEKPLGCLSGDNASSGRLDNLLQIGGSLENITFDNVVVGGQKITSETQLAPLKKLNAMGITFK